MLPLSVLTLTAGVVTSFGWTGDEADATDDVKRLGLVLSSLLLTLTVTALSSALT